MSTKQQKLLEFIVNHSPKEIGVKNIFYKVDKNKISLKFVVDEVNAPTLSSYLNSLSSIMRETRDMDIESSVYVLRKKETKKIKAELNLKELDLTEKFAFDGA